MKSSFITLTSFILAWMRILVYFGVSYANKHNWVFSFAFANVPETPDSIIVAQNFEHVVCVLISTYCCHKLMKSVAE